MYTARFRPVIADSNCSLFEIPYNCLCSLQKRWTTGLDHKFLPERKHWTAEHSNNTTTIWYSISKGYINGKLLICVNFVLFESEKFRLKKETLTTWLSVCLFFYLMKIYYHLKKLRTTLRSIYSSSSSSLRWLSKLRHILITWQFFLRR